MKKIRILGNGDLDLAPVADFLDGAGIDAQRRDEIVPAVWNSIARYLQTGDAQRRRDQLKKLTAAISKMGDAVPPLGSDDYLMLTISIGNVLPRGAWPAGRLHPLEQTLIDLDTLKRATDEALRQVDKPGRPPDARLSFVRELAEIWKAAGQEVGISGETSWDDPQTRFSRFIKICAMQTGGASQFESGFGGLIRRATGCQNTAKKSPLPALKRA